MIFGISSPFFFFPLLVTPGFAVYLMLGEGIVLTCSWYSRGHIIEKIWLSSSRSYQVPITPQLIRGFPSYLTQSMLEFYLTKVCTNVMYFDTITISFYVLPFCCVQKHCFLDAICHFWIFKIFLSPLCVAQRLNIHRPYDSSIPLFSIHPKDFIMYSPMIITVILTNWCSKK